MFLTQCVPDLMAPSVMQSLASYGLPASLFLAGLVGSAAHCTAMCSPFVLAQMQDSKTKYNFLLPYHVGRAVTYVILAVLLSSILNLAFLFSEARALFSAVLLSLASVLFLVSAFPVFQKVFPWAVRLQLVKPFPAISKMAGKLISAKTPVKRFGLGLLLGFMPCGLVVSALMAAGSASSPVMAGVSMAAFAVGTMPALMAIGLGGDVLRRRFPKVAGALPRAAMAMSAVWLFVLAGWMIL